MDVNVWVNGEELMNEIVDDFYTADPMMEFFFNFNGSGPDDKARDDWARYGDLYISGVPVQ